MTTVHVADDTLQVRLTPFEKIAGLLGDLDVPLSAVRAATAVPDGARAVRGLRAPGLAVPGWRRIGTWRGRRAKRYVVVRSGKPALHLRLSGARYDELIVTTSRARDLADRLAPRP